MGKIFIVIIQLVYILVVMLPVIEAELCENLQFNNTDERAWKDMEENITVQVNDENGKILISVDSKNIQDHLKESTYLKLCTYGLSVNVSFPKNSSVIKYQDLGKDVKIDFPLDSCTEVNITIEAFFLPDNVSLPNSPFVIRRSLLTRPKVRDLNVTVPAVNVPISNVQLNVSGIDLNCRLSPPVFLFECSHTGHYKSKPYDKTINLDQLCPKTTHDCIVTVQQYMNSKWNQVSPNLSVSISTKGIDLSFTRKSRQIDVEVPAELSKDVYQYEVLALNSTLEMEENACSLRNLTPNQMYTISLKVSGINNNSIKCQYLKTWWIRTAEDKPEGTPSVLKQSHPLSASSIKVHWTYENVTLNGNLTSFTLNYKRMSYRDELVHWSNETQKEIVVENLNKTWIEISGLSQYCKYEVKVAVSNSLHKSDWSAPIVYLTESSILVTKQNLLVKALSAALQIELDLKPELYAGRINGTLFRKNEAYGIEKSFELDHDSFQNGMSFTIDQDIKPCFGYKICMNLTIGKEQQESICANTTKVPPNVPRPPKISINFSSNDTININTTDKGDCLPDEYEIKWTSKALKPQEEYHCGNEHEKPHTLSVPLQKTTPINPTTLTNLNFPANSQINLTVRGHNNHSWGASSIQTFPTLPSLRDAKITFTPKPSENAIELSSFLICPDQGKVSTMMTCPRHEKGECNNLTANEWYEFCVTFELVSNSSNCATKTCKKEVCQDVQTTCNEVSVPEAMLTSISPMEALTPFNPFLQARVKLPANTFLDNKSVIELDLVGANSELAIPLTLDRDIVITTKPTFEPGEQIKLGVKAKGCKNNRTTNMVTTQTPIIEAALIQIDHKSVEIDKGRCKVSVSELVVNLCFLKETTYQIGMNRFSMTDLFIANSSNSCVGPALWTRSNKTGIDLEFNSSLTMLPIQIHYKCDSRTLLKYSYEIQLPPPASQTTVISIFLVLVLVIICALIYWIFKCGGAQTACKFYRRIKEWNFNTKLRFPNHSGLAVELNPIIQSAPSAPIAIQMFDQRIHEPNFNLKLDFSSIKSWDIEVNIPKTSKSVGQAHSSPGASLNRYNNIIPYNHCRVILKTLVDGKDYVNASWIRNHHGERRFIATQGPLPDTRQAFWQMILDHEVSLIVMVTRLKEGGNVKCYQYWPGKHDRQFGPIRVASMTKSKRELHLKGLALAQFRVTMGEKTIDVRHLHYQEWPDHGVPESPDSILELRRSMNTLMAKSDPLSTVVVHCSAGVGRTGTLIGLDNILNQIEEGATHIDVPRVVCQMREDRCYMVQQPGQYLFLVMAVAKYIRSMQVEQEDPHENEEDYEYDYIYHDDI